MKPDADVYEQYTTRRVEWVAAEILQLQQEREFCNHLIARMNILSKETCIPCEGGVNPLTPQEVADLLPGVSGWQEEHNKKIWREFTFKNFIQAIDFINRIAHIAEHEGHHPDLFLHDYKHVRVELTTHAIQGLSRNDFILAAKINGIV